MVNAPMKCSSYSVNYLLWLDWTLKIKFCSHFTGPGFNLMTTAHLKIKQSKIEISLHAVDDFLRNYLPSKLHLHVYRYHMHNSYPPHSLTQGECDHIFIINVSHSLALTHR